MQQRKYIVFAWTIILISIIVYAFCFWGQSLSDETTDWGAFGNYVGIGIGLLSVTLIYVTYNEQRLSNRIDRFEHHLHIMFDTLSELAKKKEVEISDDYQRLLRHFTIPFYDISDYEEKKIGNVCTYYWSQIVYDKVDDYDQVFKYLHLAIRYIQEEQILQNEEKEGRIIELSCILPEAIRNLFFFWLIQNDSKMLSYCYSNRVFPSDEQNENLLSDIIHFVCTGQKPIKKNLVPINVEDIELEDYSNEPFDKTYIRLFKYKK